MSDLIERRSTASEFDVRADADGAPTITGYAAMFDTTSHDLGGFRETIAPGAFTKTLRERGDVVALFNHDRNFILGRTSAKTARVWTDQRGLAYEVKPPATTWATDLVESMRRGDISESSFAFRTVKDRWASADDGGELRTLLEVRLVDVSPVTMPAYPQTVSTVRAAAESDGRQYVDLEALDALVGRVQRGRPLTEADVRLLNESIEVLVSLRPIEPVLDHSDGEASRGGYPLALVELELHLADLAAV